MANRAFATIKIATKEKVDNACIVDFLKGMDFTKISPIEEFFGIKIKILLLFITVRLSILMFTIW